jgi:hypothetical protein
VGKNKRERTTTMAEIIHKEESHRLGLLVNFGAHGKLEWERIVR